jgi:hypothetical protein
MVHYRLAGLGFYYSWMNQNNTESINAFSGDRDRKQSDELGASLTLRFHFFIRVDIAGIFRVFVSIWQPVWALTPSFANPAPAFLAAV